MADIIVDIIPRTARQFLNANPTIEDIIGVSDGPSPQYHLFLLEYLKNKHRTVSSYIKQEWVPEGKSPALYLELDGITGSFMLLIDRAHDDTYHYQAVNFRDSDTRRVTDTNYGRVTVEWYAMHVSGEAPTRKAYQ